jgi:serine/threonine protein kinase
VLVRKIGEGSQGETYEALCREGRDDERKDEAKNAAPRAVTLANDWARFVRERERSSGGGAVPKGARLVAIKCFRVSSAKVWKDVELAEREARTLASLEHPHLPRYFEHFEEDGALYLVMEKIEGESLAALRKRGGKASSAAEITRMIEDIAGALRYLHGLAPPVVHRDIKPGNIIRRPDGSYALVDFGAVRDRLRPAGGSTVVGTFGFMAPEQFQGRASAASDVYGLAATAITMLTGVDPEDLPHEGLGIDVARALPKGLPGSLVRALEAMLVPDPDRRAASIDEALAHLHGERIHRDEERVLSQPSGRVARKQQRARAKKEKEEQKRAKRARKDARRGLSRRARTPLVPRLLARLLLFVVMLSVWLTVGMALPLVLGLLSLVFGPRLRSAAGRCVEAAKRSQAALARASRWLSAPNDERGIEAGAGNPHRVRVAEGGRRGAAVGSTLSRVAPDDENTNGAEGVDAWMDERIQKEAERERMRLHARAPTRTKGHGRRR